MGLRTWVMGSHQPSLPPPPPPPTPEVHRVPNSEKEGAARGQGLQARPRGRPGDPAELGSEVAPAAPPEGVRSRKAAGSPRTSCEAPKARVGH